MSRNRPILLASLALAASSLLSVAEAQTAPTSVERIEIAFQPADLRDPARLQALRDRVETAATELCRDQLLGDLLRPVTLRACIRDTTARAMDQLESHRAATVLLASREEDTEH